MQIGGAIELAGVLPLGSTVSLSGAIILDDDVNGWALGVGLSF